MKKKIFSILLSTCILAATLSAGMISASAGALNGSGGSVNSATWLIDPGHGGVDSGAVNGSRHEADDNLRMSKEIGRLLELNGESVAYTRVTDTTLELSDRSNIQLSGSYAYFLSVHRNSSDASSANGIETFYYNGESSTSTSAVLAGNIQSKLVDTGLFTNRGVKSENFHVLRETSCPAALVELGFITNAADNANYDQSFSAIATAVASGCLAQVGKTFNSGTPAYKTKTLDFFENPTTDIWGVSSSTKTASSAFSPDSGLRVTATSNSTSNLVRTRFSNNNKSNINLAGFDGISFKVKRNSAHSGTYMGVRLEGDTHYAASVPLSSSTSIQEFYIPFTSFKVEGATGEPSGSQMPASQLPAVQVLEITTKYGSGAADYEISDIYACRSTQLPIPDNKVKLVDYQRNVGVEFWGTVNGAKSAVTTFSPDKGYSISATSNSASNLVRTRFFNTDSRKFDFSGFNGIYFKVKKNATHGGTYMAVRLESDVSYAAAVSLAAGTGVQEVFVPFSAFREEGATGEPMSSGAYMSTEMLSKIRVVEATTKYGNGVASYEISDIYGASYSEAPTPDYRAKLVDFYSGTTTDLWGISTGSATASTAFTPDSGKLISATSNSGTGLVRARFSRTGGYDLSKMNGLTFKIKKNAAHSNNIVSVHIDNGQDYYVATIGFGSGTTTKEVFVPFSKFRVEGATGEPAGAAMPTSFLSTVQVIEIDTKYGNGVANYEISDIYGYSYASLEKPGSMAKTIDFSGNPRRELWEIGSGSITASSLFAPNPGMLISATSNTANKTVRARFSKPDNTPFDLSGASGVYFKIRVNSAHTNNYLSVRLESPGNYYAAYVPMPAVGQTAEVFVPFSKFKIEGATGEPIGAGLNSASLPNVNVIEITSKYGNGVANYEISDIYAATYLAY